MARIAIAVLDDHRSRVMAHAGLGQRKGGRAEGAFGRHPPDQPLGAPASGTMIDLMLPIHGMISAACGIMPHVQIAERWNRSHTKFLSA